MENNQANGNFLKSSNGRWVITAICAIVIWGLMALFLVLEIQVISFIIIGVCVIFGWKALNRIQPAMFLWMSWVGWVIYFFVKLTIAAIIGFFIAPFIIGKMVGGKVHEAIQGEG